MRHGRGHEHASLRRWPREAREARALVERLVERRRELGMSIMELAERSGLAQSTVSMTMAFHNIPTTITFTRLAVALGMRVDLVTLEPHGAENQVATTAANPTGQLDGVDGVGIGDVPTASGAARRAGDSRFSACACGNSTRQDCLCLEM